MASRLARPLSLFSAIARPSTTRPAVFPRTTTAANPVLCSLRTMASAPAQSEWLVVVPDFPGTLEKRLEVRGTHLANVLTLRDTGKLKLGGAIVHDIPSDSADPTTYKFAGSTIIAVAETRDEVVKLLEGDIYAKTGVWDVAKAQIYWLKTAFRLP